MILVYLVSIYKRNLNMMILIVMLKKRNDFIFAVI